jgi:hypothetical protein
MPGQIAIAEPVPGSEHDITTYSDPTWKYVDKSDIFVLILDKRIDRMTRVDMTRLLMWIPKFREQLRADRFEDWYIETVAKHVLFIRKSVRLLLAGRQADM